MQRNGFWKSLGAVLGVALLVAVIGSLSHHAWAHPEGYVLTPLAFLGDPAPGGGTFLSTFESNVINNRGEVLFGSNVPPEVTPDEFGPAGVFLLRKGVTSQLARTGEPAPGGGDFAPPGFLSPITLNDRGDVAFAFLLAPFPSFPIGVTAGVYRFSRATQTVTPVVIPGMTPAPGGGVFAGAGFGASLNDRGDLGFSGIVPTDKGLPFPEQLGLGQGIFRARKNGAISSLVSPGDAAPGGGTFDLAFAPWINNWGHVAFQGHVAGEECLDPHLPPPVVLIACLGSVYVKNATTGKIRSIAHAGDHAPGGGTFRQAISPVLNDWSEIAFLGDLTPAPDTRQVTGVYLYRLGSTIAVARPGVEMPGGGRFVTSALIGGWQLHINNVGEVAFNATVDTDDNGDGFPDTGLYLWSHGQRRLVARTGTEIPGVGTIAHLVQNVPVVAPPASGHFPSSGANNNDFGQVVFGATLSDGRGVLLLATPKR